MNTSHEEYHPDFTLHSEHGGSVNSQPKATAMNLLSSLEVELPVNTPTHLFSCVCHPRIQPCLQDICQLSGARRPRWAARRAQTLAVRSPHRSGFPPHTCPPSPGAFPWGLSSSASPLSLLAAQRSGLNQGFPAWRGGAVRKAKMFRAVLIHVGATAMGVRFTWESSQSTADKLMGGTAPEQPTLMAC